jgi:hypothetical protein
MISDHKNAVAVFLGPSLPLQAAREILDARYLPPAQFGDVYRLIGSGVSTIVLIDGLFHSPAPVWERELLYAMQSGIRVYGASSMGALRAAELYPHGMIGLGSIFQWYVTGEIDGDDEVARLHAGPELLYWPLSEPLVNIRFNVREAVARGIIEREQAAALIAAMKAMPFWERTMDALWNTPAFCSMDESRQAGLCAFFADHAIDLKQQDAAQCLREVARRRDEPQAVASSIPEGRATSSYHDRLRLLKRTFPRDHNLRVDGQALVDRVFSDPARRKVIQRSLAAQFFVREWAREHRVSVPAGDLAVMVAAFHDRVVSPFFTAWLRENGLTETEHRELLARHLLGKWLLTQMPEQLGLSPAVQDEALLPVFPALGVLEPLCDRASLARALPYIAAWCQWAGAAPGAEATQALIRRWRGALEVIQERYGAALREPFLQAVWALEKGPIHFGFTTWSPSTELLCELQITGTASRLAAAWEATAP